MSARSQNPSHEFRAASNHEQPDLSYVKFDEKTYLEINTYMRRTAHFAFQNLLRRFKNIPKPFRYDNFLYVCWYVLLSLELKLQKTGDLDLKLRRFQSTSHKNNQNRTQKNNHKRKQIAQSYNKTINCSRTRRRPGGPPAHSASFVPKWRPVRAMGTWYAQSALSKLIDVID